MRTFEVAVWPPGENRYTVEQRAWGELDARRIVARREGVQEKHVTVWGTVDDESSSSSSSSFDFGGDIGGKMALLSLLFFIWLVVEYWYIVLPIGIIVCIIGIYKLFNRE